MNNSMAQVEKSWRLTLPKFTSTFIYKAFPEAQKFVIPEKLDSLREERRHILSFIEAQLRKSQFYNHSGQILMHGCIEQLEVPKLIEIERQIAFIKRVLNGNSKVIINNESNREKARSRCILEIAEMNNLNLTRMGNHPKSICPFHQERTESCVFYPETNSFYCFGCGKGGDVITFVREFHDLSFPDSISYLLNH